MIAPIASNNGITVISGVQEYGSPFTVSLFGCRSTSCKTESLARRWERSIETHAPSQQHVGQAFAPRTAVNRATNGLCLQTSMCKTSKPDDSEFDLPPKSEWFKSTAGWENASFAYDFKEGCVLFDENMPLGVLAPISCTVGSLEIYANLHV